MQRGYFLSLGLSPGEILAVVTLSGVLAGSAVAEEAAPTSAVQESEGLQEIVVTATKRESSLDKTPMSLTAVTGEQLQAEGVTNIEEIALRTPGVAITSQGVGRTTYTMRGMSPSGGATPTVGYYIDDAPISAPAAQFSGRNEISPDLYDLQRVEVLRGPQGTLFGAGSMGGTIRMITNPPELNKEELSAQGIGSATQGGGGNYAANGMLNLPIGGLFALRVVASDKFNDGYIDRVVVAPFPPPTGPNLTVRGDVQNAPVDKVYNNVNDAHTQAVRATLFGQVTDAFSVKSSIFYQRDAQAGSNTIDLPPGDFRQYQPFDIPEGFRDTFSLYTLVLKYELSSFSISSDSSIITRSSATANNDSENYYTLFGTGFFTPGPTFSGTSSREVTEELRLTSTGSGPLQWVGGFFYDDFRDRNAFTEEAPAFLPIFGESQIFDFAENDSIRQYAVFGDLNYRIFDPLTATVGLRYFRYDFGFSQEGIGLVIPPQNQVAAGTSSHSGFNPKATLQYTPTDKQMYYVTAARGFRPGAPNPPIPGNVAGGVDCGTDLAGLGLAAAPKSYDPDYVWSYELGGKFRPTRSLQIDADVYHLNWNHIQQGFTLNCGFSFTANAGDAVANGAEFELTALLAPGLTFSQSVGYVHAELTHENVGTVSVDEVQNVPEWTFTSSLEYSRPLMRDWELTARVDDQFTGREYDPTAQPYPIDYRAGFNMMNLRIGARKDRFSANLFVNNLTDRFAILGFEPGLSANIPSVTRAIPVQPRTAGIDLQWSF